MTGERLRSPRLEMRAKRVNYASGFNDFTGVAGPGKPMNSDLLALISAIAHDRPVPERYYRSGIDRDDDALLALSGIKHLHLGGPQSDILVFLVEYEECVVLLEINDHKHFRTDPVGSLLRSLHDTYLTAEDRAAAARRDQRAVVRRATIRTGLKPRRPR